MIRFETSSSTGGGCCGGELFVRTGASWLPWHQAATQARLDRSLLDEVGDDLVRGSLALLGAALHVALEVHRTVLTGEVHIALPDALITGEVLSVVGRPVRVRAERIRIQVPCRHQRLAIPLRGQTRVYRFDLAQESERVLASLRIIGGAERPVRSERARHVAADVVNQNALRSRLSPTHFPGILIAGVGEGQTGGTARPGAGSV